MKGGGRNLNSRYKPSIWQEVLRETTKTVRIVAFRTEFRTPNLQETKDANCPVATLGPVFLYGSGTWVLKNEIDFKSLILFEALGSGKRFNFLQCSVTDQPS